MKHAHWNNFKTRTRTESNLKFAIVGRVANNELKTIKILRCEAEPTAIPGYSLMTNKQILFSNYFETLYSTCQTDIRE